MADEPTEPPVEAAPDRRELLAQALDAAEAQTPDAEALAPSAPEAAAPAAAADVPVEPVVEEPVWKRPPASWKKEYHDVWATAASNPDLSRLVQYAAQREDEMRSGIEPLIPKAKFADEINKALEPYRENQRMAGVEPVAAITGLMQADHILRNAPMDQKKAYALNLLAQYGIQLTPEDAFQQSTAPVVPPGYVPLQNVQNLVKTEISAWESGQADAALREEIEKFKQDKPDFDTLVPYMQPLLEKGLVPDLAAAYEKAKRLDDTSYTQMQEALQAKALADRSEAADKAAKAAKAAAVSVKSSTPGARTPTKAQDRRALLAEQLDSLTERF